MAKHGAEIEQLERELATMEAALQAHYSQMGKSMLELVGNEQNTVNRLVDDIVDTKKRLSLAKKEKQCPECMVHNSSDSRFCRHCGVKLA